MEVGMAAAVMVGPADVVRVVAMLAIVRVGLDMAAMEVTVAMVVGLLGCAGRQ